MCGAKGHMLQACRPKGGISTYMCTDTDSTTLSLALEEAGGESNVHADEKIK